MKVLVVGASGAIGGAMLAQTLVRPEVKHVIVLTRKQLPEKQLSSLEQKEKLETIVVQDFGRLDDIQDETWNKILDAAAIVWAMGTYVLNEDVNLKYPLAFQEAFIQRLPISRQGAGAKFKVRFIVLGGAFVEPNQSSTLFFLGDQRRMKGVLQTKSLELGTKNPDIWNPIVVRPGGVMFGGSTLRNRVGGAVFGTKLAIRSEELGACTAEIAINGSAKSVVENQELVNIGRKALRDGG